MSRRQAAPPPSPGTRRYVVRSGRNRYHLIPYIGNKSGFSHIFDDLVPADAGGGRIVDVFGGGGSFSIYCCYNFGSDRVTYNDNNPTVVNFIKCVRDDPEGLLGQYAEHRERSDPRYYLEVRDKSLDDGLVGAGRFLYLAKNAFSGKIRFNGSNKFNTPMRKDSKCPDEPTNIRDISKIIRDIKITNESYEYYDDVKDSFLYLDPPYMGNPNNHYNGVPETEDFIGFVKRVEEKNLVMISEQNDRHTLKLSDRFRVYPVFLRRSLQYYTQSGSKEIVAVNYAPPQKIPPSEIAAPP